MTLHTLHYSVALSQILIQILMKKLGIKKISGSLSSQLLKLSILISRIIIIFGPLQALVLRWSYLGRRDLFAEFKSHSGNLANIKKDCP